MSKDFLIKQISRFILEHSYLHLGEYTLAEFISKELNISKTELKELEQYLNIEEVTK